MRRFTIALLSLVCLVRSLSGQDPDLRLSRILSLPEVVTLALERNLTLQRSQIQIELRENDVNFQEADAQPNLTVSAGGNLRYAGDGREPVWNTAELTDSASGSLNSSVILYNGGERKASLEQARTDLEVSMMEYDRSQQFVLFQSVFRYLEAVLRLKEIDIQKDELEIRKENLERIEVGYENEIRILADVLRQKALVADSERRLAQAQRAHETSLYILKDLLLIPPETQIQFNLENSDWGNTESLPEPFIEQSLALIMERPDLIAQEYRLEAADQGIRIAKAGRKATVSA
ncbi:MAG: TolC family protein, partial [Verrucomicrobia bacterium]|nr:TolC family protein [Verrucomicrobiota bacterium]